MTPARSIAASPARLVAALTLTASLLTAASCGIPPPPSATPPSTVPPPRSAPANSPSAPDAHRIGTGDFSDAERAALRIRNVGCGGVATGSGFAVADHVLVTNRHVVGGATTLQVSTYDGRDLTVTASAAAGIADLAVVRTKETLPRTIPLAAQNPAVGERVTAVGYPLGGKLTTTQGTVLGYAPDPVGESAIPMLVNDAAIEHGSSGGPLLDDAGKLVGVVYATSGAVQQYAVPVEVLAELIRSPGRFDAESNCDGVLQAVVPDTATRCGETVFAGAQTSCPFALAVAAAWEDAGRGTARLRVRSPQTGRDYVMECRVGGVIVCTGGVGATVYITT